MVTEDLYSCVYNYDSLYTLMKYLQRQHGSVEPKVDSHVRGICGVTFWSSALPLSK